MSKNRHSATSSRTHIHQISDDEGPALLRCPRLLLFQQIKFAPKREEVGEERVEVTFRRKVEEDGVVGVIKMGEDAKKLSVDVAGYRGEVGRELAACGRLMGGRTVPREGSEVHGEGCAAMKIGSKGGWIR